MSVSDYIAGKILEVMEAGFCICPVPLKSNIMDVCLQCKKPVNGEIKEMKREPCVSDPNHHGEQDLADKVKRRKEKEGEFTKVNDSGERRKTATGAVRDRQQ